MAALAKLLATGLLVWFGSLALLITLRMLRGDIRVSGLLTHDGKQMDPERVIAALVFPFVIAMYAVEALNADVTATTGRPRLPDVPDYLLTLFVGGNGLYLAGKILRRP
jgi:hypothetical protein